MTLEGFAPEVLLPAFAAGLLVLATHVPLGMEVLRRGIIFIDLAVAQFAGLGIVAAAALGAERHGWQMQAAALAAALAGALFLRWREKRDPAQQEAVIGVAFVAAACATILVLAKDPHGGEHMRELLVGQILWTTWGDLVPLALVSVAVMAGWLGFRLAFYPLFAVAITASVQFVGVYLVFASLIVPALAARGSVATGSVVGVLGYAAGLFASALFDLPAGAAIVLALLAAAVAARALSHDAKLV